MSAVLGRPSVLVEGLRIAIVDRASRILARYRREPVDGEMVSTRRWATVIEWHHYDRADDAIPKMLAQFRRRPLTVFCRRGVLQVDARTTLCTLDNSDHARLTKVESLRVALTLTVPAKRKDIRRGRARAWPALALPI